MEVLWTFMVGMITSDKVKKESPTDKITKISFFLSGIFVYFGNYPTV